MILGKIETKEKFKEKHHKHRYSVLKHFSSQYK